MLEKVNSWYDIPWTEINIEEINTILTDLQNKCKKLPKALKDYQVCVCLLLTADDDDEHVARSR